VEGNIADLYLLLPIHEVAMMDFHESRKVEAAGYGMSKPMIDEWLAGGGWPTTSHHHPSGPDLRPPPAQSSEYPANPPCPPSKAMNNLLARLIQVRNISETM